MILAIDAYYNVRARVVGILFSEWEDKAAQRIISKNIEDISEYKPGEFYKRELPCIIEIIKEIDLHTIDAIVIDGYVYLDDSCKFGLGAHLYQELNGKVPVIGVAKTAFHNNNKNVVKITRGNSLNPLYITSVGIDTEKAAQCIINMSGNYRIPTLLKQLDQATKSKE